jgi:hypothetical protein
LNKRLSTILLTLVLTAIATTTPVLAKISPLYKQGYERGIADAQTNQNAGLASMSKMSPNDVDCDSDVDSLSTSVCSLAILNLMPSDSQFSPEVCIAVNTLPPGFGV